MLKCSYSSRSDPSIEPVLIGELKEEGRISYADHDDLLQTLIQESRMWVEENELKQALVTQTVTEYFDRFDSDGLELRWNPAQSITSVQYVDSNGTTQTLSADTYELGSVLGLSCVRLQYGQTWPTTRDHADAVIVTYVAGFGDSRLDVPLSIRSAVKAYAIFRYDGNVDHNLLLAARRLLGPYSLKR